ncbi:MAG: aerolysin family beta-barrel pore-forming toxin [Byssovorax sp.]
MFKLDICAVLLAAVASSLTAGCAAPVGDDENEGTLADELTDPKIQAMKSNIMDQTLFPLADVATGMGYAWVEGCYAPTVGYAYDKVLTGDLSNTEWTPRDEYQCNENTSAKSGQRTHIKYVNWRLHDLGVTYDPAKIKTTYTHPLTFPSFTYRNPSSSVLKTNVGPVTHTLMTELAATVTNGWDFTLTAGYTAEVSFFGLAKEQLSFSATAGVNGSVAKAKTTINSIETSYSPPIAIPAHKKWVVTVALNQTQKTAPIQGRSELQFDIEYDGFLKYSYNARADFPRDRPTWNKNYGDWSNLDNTVRNSLDGWSWSAMKDRGLQLEQYDEQPSVNWGLNSLANSLGGAASSAKRINVMSYGGSTTLSSDAFTYSVKESTCYSPNC